MTNSVNTRAIVLDMLLEILEQGQYSHLTLRSVLDKYQYLEKQERSFMTRLTEGTIERLIELDYIIDFFSKVKVAKMKPVIRNILRMAVYQIKYMDAVPNSAACNEAVKLAKKRGLGQLSGFVNGILRTVVRDGSKVLFPEKKTEPLRYLELTYSMPHWIVEKWVKAYGFEQTEAICQAFLQDYPLSIRTNTAKCTPEELKKALEDEGVWVSPVPGLSYAFDIEGFDYLSNLKSFAEGMFYVQDISSMMVAEAAGVKPGDYVIDVCAAPGGKSTHLAELMKESGMVEARDLTSYKVGLIEENIRRHQLTNMKAVCMDATVKDAASVEKADVLICDLPCSGLGIMGKKTDIRYKMTPQTQENLVQLQHSILQTVHDYVKHGGTLVYSTCTINPDENENMVARFLDEYEEFTLEEQKQMLPGTESHDGFFIAKLTRK